MADFRSECIKEADRLLSSGVTPEELACKGVEQMIRAAQDGVMLMLGHCCNCDPQQTHIVGEVFFIRALEEIRNAAAHPSHRP